MGCEPSSPHQRWPLLIEKEEEEAPEYIAHLAILAISTGGPHQSGFVFVNEKPKSIAGWMPLLAYDSRRPISAHSIPNKSRAFASTPKPGIF
jgi:hypothetical protein